MPVTMSPLPTVKQKHSVSPVALVKKEYVDTGSCGLSFQVDIDVTFVHTNSTYGHLVQFDCAGQLFVQGQHMPRVIIQRVPCSLTGSKLLHITELAAVDHYEQQLQQEEPLLNAGSKLALRQTTSNPMLAANCHGSKVLHHGCDVCHTDL